MWAGGDDTLSLGELIAMPASYDATGYYSSSGSRQSRVVVARSLALQPGEGVIQVEEAALRICTQLIHPYMGRDEDRDSYS